MEAASGGSKSWECLPPTGEAEGCTLFPCGKLHRRADLSRGMCSGKKPERKVKLSVLAQESSRLPTSPEAFGIHMPRLLENLRLWEDLGVFTSA